MTDTQVSIDQLSTVEALNLLRSTMDKADVARADLDQFLATYPLAVEIAERTDEVSQLRKLIEARMIAEGTKTLSTGKIRATIVTKHDYKIADGMLFQNAAMEDGKEDEWMIWDMAAIKKFASKFRKDHDGANYPGITDVPKSWIEVTPL